MNNSKKIIFGLLVIFLLAASPVFSLDTDFENLQSAADKVIDELAGSLPFNSTIGLNWSDAYIGKIPSFGIGASIGATTINFTAITDLLAQFGTDIPFNDSSFIKGIGFPIPAYTAELRIGGIVIPMDIGFKFGLLKPESSQKLLDKFTSDAGFGLDYMLVGGDVRYAIIDKKVFPIRLSVGFGVNYMKGGISSTIPAALSFSGDIGGVDFTVSQTDPKMDVLWKTLNFELKTQVSFPFKIITPYVGAGVSYSLSEAGYKVSTPNLEITPVGIDLEDLKDVYGFTDISTDGFEYIKKINSFNLRAFGGLSLNLVFVRLDLTAMYNILNNNFGTTVGLRFQM